MGGVICVREGDGGVISIGYFGIGARTVLPAIDKGEEEVGGVGLRSVYLTLVELTLAENRAVGGSSAALTDLDFRAP